MESTTENRKNIFKRRKLNIFQIFSHRISKFFHLNRTKADQNERGERALSKSSLTDITVTSKSHDDLSMKHKSKGKSRKSAKTLRSTTLLALRKVFRSKKCIPKSNNRCLSEGDLTRKEEKFYSQESFPQASIPQTCEASTNECSNNAPNIERAFSHKDGHSFKNELALKLRAKNQVKDDDSENSKTPDSPNRCVTGSSPSRQGDGELRTPRSMSSLSQSSNSLMSGTHATNYGLSDGESMSRSMIDFSDDIGIVVDLATPICKTTTASLLDSTAARQKIAASKARRARPKALGTVTCDISLTDGPQFSPVRDKRDILEEISEEECPQSPHSPEIPEYVSISTVKRPQSYPTKDYSSEDLSLTATKLSKKSQSSMEDLSNLNETGDSTKEKIHSLTTNPDEPPKTKDGNNINSSLSNDEVLTSEKIEKVSKSIDSKENATIKSSSVTENSSQSKERTRFNVSSKVKSPSSTDKSSLPSTADKSPPALSSDKSSPSVYSDIILPTSSSDKSCSPTNIDKSPALSSLDEAHSPTSDVNEGKVRFSENKSKFHADEDKSEPTPRFYVKLRPVRNIVSENNSEKSKDHRDDSNVPFHNLKKTIVFKDKDLSSDPSKDKDASNITHYVPLRQTNVNAARAHITPDTAPSTGTTATKDCLTSSSLTVSEKRASKVLDIVKNLEGVPCLESK